MARPKRNKFFTREAYQIMAMLEFFLDGHGLMALDYLTGQSAFPDCLEIAELRAAVSAAKCDDIETRISRSRKHVFDAQRAIESAERIERLIKYVGGSKRIVDVFLWYKRECPQEFSILEDWVQIGRPGKAPTIEMLAMERHMSTKTLRNTKDMVLEQIARELCRRGRILLRQNLSV